MSMAEPVLKNSDITIYNKYVDSTTRSEKYQRTVVSDVDWQGTKAASATNGGLLASNSVTIYIPFARGTQYVKPIAWQALTTKTGYWTLREGDVIVRNTVTDEISDAFTMTALKAKYDDVVTITSVDAMDQGSANMQHWQVGAK